MKPPTGQGSQVSQRAGGPGQHLFVLPDYGTQSAQRARTTLGQNVVEVPSSLTSQYVYVYGDRLSEAGRARVDAGVGGPRVLHHQEAGRHVALVRDHAHAAARRVVRYYLKKEFIRVVYA